MTLATDLLSQTKAHARVDHDDEDGTLLAMLEAALGDVLAVALAGDLVGGGVFTFMGMVRGPARCLNFSRGRNQDKNLGGGGGLISGAFWLGTGAWQRLSTLTQFFWLMRAQGARARARLSA